MKINFNDDEITIYLNKYYTKEIDFKDVDYLEDYMNDLFDDLKNFYNVRLNGYYCIDVFIDDNYGAIIEINKENIEYYDYFDDQINTQVTIHNNLNFLYKISDFLEIKKILNIKYNLYKYNNELYIKLNEEIDNIKLGNILEYCTEICYDIEQIAKTNNLLFCNK